MLVGAPLTLLTMAATVGWTTLTGVFVVAKGVLGREIENVP